MANSTTKKILGTAFNVIVGRDKKRHAHGDATREVFETVVFVVVLVLMLKLFVAEAFVIPTGSMASTLWGDQVKVECPECGYVGPVSAAVQNGRRTTPKEVICQNCGVEFVPSNPTDWNSGDRVLVAKFEYNIRPPRRFDVPVFKYPAEPYSASDKTAMNYIKRLIGLPGETIAIYKGDLYRTTKLHYEGYPRPPEDRPQDLWMYEYTYPMDKAAVDAFTRGEFEPIRKSPEEILRVRRLVFDYDRQPKSLTGLAKTRWEPVPDNGAGWTLDDKRFTHSGGNSGWVRYQHVEAGSWRAGQPAPPRQPQPIMDFLEYNIDWVTNKPVRASYWVPDLIVECKADFQSPSDHLTLEINKAEDKFQAEFADGSCKLFRIHASEKPELLAEQPTKIGAGSYSLRFANVDSRLTVWVDGTVLNFGDKSDYSPPDREKFEPTSADTNEPIRIGALGSVTVSGVQVWRDVYYTCYSRNDCGVQTYYVQPGHYFCLGDNSASSKDGRDWGLVPERLMLGRAEVIYWPLSRIRVIK
jgi:signal peptidase I